jgi:hypothetical protein
MKGKSFINIVPILNLDNIIPLSYDSEKENYEDVLDKLRKIKTRFNMISEYK